MVCVPVMHICDCPVYCKVHCTVGWKPPAQIVQIDFRSAFDMVNHYGILDKFCYVGIGGSVLPILVQLLSNRSQHVMVDVCRSKLVTLYQKCRRAVFWERYCSS